MPDEYTKDKDKDNHVEENQCKNGTQKCAKEHSNITDETAAKLKKGKKPLLYDASIIFYPVTPMINSVTLTQLYMYHTSINLLFI